MTDITTLCNTLEAAKVTGGDITISAQDFTALMRLASMMGDPNAAITSLASSFATLRDAIPQLADPVGEDDIVTLTEVCERLKVSRQTLHRWRRDKKFNLVPVNAGGTKWLRRDFIQWIAER